MSTQSKHLFIDAVVVYGIGRTFTGTLNQATEETKDSTTPEFEPMDLSDLVIRFRVLGSAHGDGAILLEKVITSDTDVAEIGVIEEPTSGEFSFTITAEDTKTLGLGNKPITLELLDADSLELVALLTEGGSNQGEFSRLQIVNT